MDPGSALLPAFRGEIADPAWSKYQLAGQGVRGVQLLQAGIAELHGGPLEGDRNQRGLAQLFCIRRARCLVAPEQQCSAEVFEGSDLGDGIVDEMPRPRHGHGAVIGGVVEDVVLEASTSTSVTARLTPDLAWGPPAPTRRANCARGFRRPCVRKRSRLPPGVLSRLRRDCRRLRRLAARRCAPWSRRSALGSAAAGWATPRAVFYPSCGPPSRAFGLRRCSSGTRERPGRTFMLKCLANGCRGD